MVFRGVVLKCWGCTDRESKLIHASDVHSIQNRDCDGDFAMIDWRSIAGQLDNCGSRKIAVASVTPDLNFTDQVA